MLQKAPNNTVKSQRFLAFLFVLAMSGEKKQKPEELLNKLRKLEENKHCVNCGEYAKLGHANVCGKIWKYANDGLVPYCSFVCHNCKSAHQSFSHRVKVIE